MTVSPGVDVDTDVTGRGCQARAEHYSHPAREKELALIDPAGAWREATSQRRSSRPPLTASSTQRETLPRAILRCHLAWAAGSNRFRGFGRSSIRMSLATGFAPRVITISFSTCKRASASGHR